MTTRTTITEGWPATPTITASGDTSVLIRNTHVTKNLFFATTADDTPPAFDAGLAHRVLPAHAMEQSERGLTLKDTERLWIASTNGSIEATITTGGA